MDRRTFITSGTASLMGLFLIPGFLRAAGKHTLPESYSAVILGDTHFDSADPEKYHIGYTDPKPEREAHHRKEFVRNGKAWSGYCRELVNRAACLVDKDTRYVFQMGDLIQGDTANADIHKKFLDDTMAYFKSAVAPDLPFVTVVGNHDIRGNDDSVAYRAYEEYMTARMSEELDRRVDGTSFVFRSGPDAFVVLNYFTASYPVVEKLLGQAQGARHIFLLVHTPVFPFDSKKYWWWHLLGDRTDSRHEERLQVRRLLAKNQVIVLCGHVHTTEFLDWYGDGGRITQMTMSSIWTKESQGRYEPLTESPGQYGKLFVGDEAVFGECRDGISSYSLAKSAGSYKLIVGDKVYVDFYAGNSPRLSKRFILRG